MGWTAALQMTRVGTKWCVGPALAAGPPFTEKPSAGERRPYINCTNLFGGRPQMAQPMNFELQAVDVGDAEAQKLMGELDLELNRRYPGVPTNGIDTEEFRAAGGYFVLLRCGGEAIGCGAFRSVEAGCVEIKRMFVREAHRGHGYSKQILRHLEDVAKSRGFRRFVLETGVRQPEAAGLYVSAGYLSIPNYGRYAGNPDSICFAKEV
jgi:GNAT superfamily N-acetyltransferase